MTPPASAPRLAVVTGAASGIGLATVEALARRGTAVVGVDLTERPAELAQADALDWVAGDVTAEDTWRQVDRLCSHRDRAGADALVACAGTFVLAPFLTTALEDWRRLYEINVLGVVRGMQTLIPRMIEGGSGAVAVVCSVNSLVVETDMSAYSTTKAALLHLVRSAAVEHAADGIRVNAVCPGIVETPLLQSHLDSLADPSAARRAAERRSPLGRFLRPAEVAEVLCFLVGEGASGMSGAAVTVDGGLIATYDFDSSDG